MFQPLAHKRLSFRSWQFVVQPVYVVFFLASNALELYRCDGSKSQKQLLRERFSLMCVQSNRRHRSNQPGPCRATATQGCDPARYGFQAGGSFLLFQVLLLLLFFYLFKRSNLRPWTVESGGKFVARAGFLCWESLLCCFLSIRIIPVDKKRVHKNKRPNLGHLSCTKGAGLAG